MTRVGFIVALVLVLSAEVGHACSCVRTRMTLDGILRHDIVFVGRVFRIEETQDFNKVVYFQVSEVWKGDLDELVVVATHYNSAGCGVDFEMDEYFFVTADDGQKYRFLADRCSRTDRLDRAERQLALLGDPTKVFKNDKKWQAPR